MLSLVKALKSEKIMLQNFVIEQNSAVKACIQESFRDIIGYFQNLISKMGKISEKEKKQLQKIMEDKMQQFEL